MIAAALARLNGTGAMGALLVRAGIVGLNVCVMMVLTFVLGLSGFGTLVYLWGAAMVLGTVVSCGGPLVLLRGLGSGQAMRRLPLVTLTVLVPAGLSLLIWAASTAFWPDPRWAVVLSVGFCLNLLSCLASVMRALGSVHVSIVLRDAVPFAALGLSAVAFTDSPAEALLGAAALMLAMAVLAALWCVWHWAVLSQDPEKPPKTWDFALWGTAMLGMALAHIDIIIGAQFMQADALGLYALLRRIANVVALPVSVATWVSAQPVAAAHRSDSPGALQAATTASLRMVWYPACAICALCLMGLVVAAALPWLSVTPQVAATFLCLLFWVLMQAFYGAGYTVATLTAHAGTAMQARALTLLAYLALALPLGQAMAPATNALALICANLLGCWLVWRILWRDLGVDTSARVLWSGGGRRWKTS